MLHAMRKGSTGWLAKGLLILLVASFAAWGIGSDMLGSSVTSNVLEAGKTTVSLGEFQREYQNQVNIASQRYQRQLTPEQAQQLGIAQQTVATLRNRIVQGERAQELKLGVTDSAVRTEITEGPSFRNEVGQFDRMRFQEVLSRNGYSEGEYINILRDEIKRAQLMESFALPGGKSPEVFTDAIYNHFWEKRSARYVEVADTRVGDAPEPTDEQLQALIDDNKASYTAPEYRSGEFILLTPDVFVGEVDVTEDEVKAEFEARANEFFTPESRAIEQMIFEKEERAIEAASRLTGGEDFAAVALDMLQLTKEDITLGASTKSDLLDELKEPVFSINEGDVTAPVKTILGWHLIRVANVTPETNKTLEDVRELVTRSVALRYASDILHDKQTALEDEFAGGASLEEAAKVVGISVQKFASLDRGGRDKNGAAVAGLPVEREFLATVFDTDANIEPTLTQTASGNYFALTVQEITPSDVRPLADVREAATAAWKAKWQHEENEKAVTALLDKLKGGATLDEIAAETNGTVKTSNVATRQEQIQGLSRDATQKLFELDDNGFAMGTNEAGNGFVLMTVGEKAAADKVADKPMFDQLSQTIAASFQEDLIAQYQSYLEKEIGFSVKEGLIREYFQQ
ncbi:hypothetical protein GUA87_11900 [Sneathiella sp. P13V-1]|uniref:peptidylprolyl isomerase n=1 Tax=Sneathiella sp. P13V-1 TaxID=2697366 RepID=UPI00187B7FD6|nr:peptidylprolyl isomerase [Sneathiella sp. P13V-1]MBE7637551.1 hypothetical protein [Sneathiella sp. P13V-1]